MSHAGSPTQGSRLICLLIGVMIATPCLAQSPPEISSVAFQDRATIERASATGAELYNVYRAAPEQLASGGLSRCHGFEV